MENDYDVALHVLMEIDLSCFKMRCQCQAFLPKRMCRCIPLGDKKISRINASLWVKETSGT